jgi:hypothetical protein
VFNHHKNALGTYREYARKHVTVYCVGQDTYSSFRKTSNVTGIKFLEISEFYPLLNKFGCRDKELNSGCESIKLYTSENPEANVTCLKLMP